MLYFFLKEPTGVLELLLSEAKRTLTKSQKEKIVNRINLCPIPLYIRLVVDVCIDLHSYEEVPVFQYVIALLAC